MTKLSFSLAIVFSTLFDAAAAVLFARRIAARRKQEERPLSLGDALLVLLVLGLAFFGKLPLLAPLGVGFFGAMCLLYIDLVVLLPLLFLALLFAARRGALRMTRAVRGAALVYALLGPLVGVYATFIETERLIIERADLILPTERAGAQPIRIGVISDLQTNRVTSFEREAFQKLMEEKPDIILLPGDLWQGFPEEEERARPQMRALLGSLHAPGGVFFVTGDCEDFYHVREILDGTGIRILHNEIAETRVGDRRVLIGGIERSYTTTAARRLMDELERLSGKDDIRILLSHRPDSVLFLSESSRVDLVVAGHTHGGQVQLPGVGPLITFSNVPRDVAAGGLHEVEGNAVYVSRGLGRERRMAPPIRFLCPPEITVLTLKD